MSIFHFMLKKVSTKVVFVRTIDICTFVIIPTFASLLSLARHNVCAFSFVFSPPFEIFNLSCQKSPCSVYFPPDLNSDCLTKHKNMFTVAPVFCPIHIINTPTLNLFYTIFSLPTPHPHPPPLYEKDKQVKSWTYQCAEFCLDNHSPNDKQWNPTSSDICEKFCWNLIFGQNLKLLGKTENYFSNQMIHCMSAWSGEEYVSW